MRFSLRFVIPLVAVLVLIGVAIVPLVESLTRMWFVRDLDVRSRLIASTMHESLVEVLQSSSNRKVLYFLNRLTKDERLFAVGFCDAQERLRFQTAQFPSSLNCRHEPLAQDSTIVKFGKDTLHVARYTVEENGLRGQVILVHDMRVIEERVVSTRKYIFFLFAALGAVISLVTVIMVNLSWRSLISGLRLFIKGGGFLKPLSQIKHPVLRPLAKELKGFIRGLETERRARDKSQIVWTPKMLKTILKEDLAGDEVLVVSNREPYIHSWNKGQIEVQVPASGLVTALEPIMRACSGTWVAHGSGSADKAAVDKTGHIRVPPKNPSYSIRPVWLTREEEKGYYYGFSNEGLWPLCHMAYTRPIFRTTDWQTYMSVNRRFADVVVEEARTSDPVILVQDYHFALLPRLIRNRLPSATIITFWHIPWPNPEAFGICPWREEILDGMLGSSIMAFHTRFHCNNFIDTIDRYLETRIDRENSTVSFGGQITAVRNYPISIEWPGRAYATARPVSETRQQVRESHQLPLDCMVGIGVDRMDYTKGILERFLAVERLLELRPEWVGRFAFIEIAAPTRSEISHYQQFANEVSALAERINERFKKGTYQPIILKMERHEPAQVFDYLRAADVCMVTSLHDGMNLVAKEFVASRDDERGVLILSQFTGAARELLEALIVNPYDIDQCAAALDLALAMPLTEQRDRMRSMRSLIQEFNVFRWAGRMLIDAARMRQRRRVMRRIHEIEDTPLMT